ncbi:ABC transporter substrate-binding protein [Primorskyibacter flagellatus]|uniref:ABC transporter substrate-binding protein n=1 Tax=Primorskyibacter flagellatus TaxID=1387277 RepID=A0A917EL35_9RHOB|nr:ABC transporter substrate-binding protein [Primorskyibacter flagellatus]GGE51568.1 ABC transporter substrate-binding protein [Primorskyibacter flagellatus]
MTFAIRKLAYSTFAAAALFVLPATADPAGTFRFAEQAKLITMDPHNHSGGGFSYLRPVYESLFDRNPDGDIVPVLADSYQVDGRTVTITLKPGITFSDGTDLTADLAARNLNRVIELGVNAGVKLAEKAEATGPDQITLTLKSPDPSIIDALSGTAGMMVSAAALDDPALDRNPVGTGPYVYSPEESREGELRVYTPAPGYRDPEAQGLARIEISEIPDNTARLNALKTGQVDLAIFLSSPQAAIVDRTPGLKLLRQPGGTTYHLSVLDREGTQVPAFADPRVRMAMNYAIDREAFSKAVEFGLSTPATQPYAEGLWAYDPALEGRYAYDLDKAKALMQEAGYAEGFEFTMPSIPIFASRLEAVAGFLKEINVTMNIQTVEPGTLARRSRTTDFPATNLVWNNAIDPKFVTTYYVAEDAVFNPFRIKPDPKLTELSEAGLAIADEAGRAPIYREMLGRLAEESYMIFITTTPILFGASDAVATNETVQFRPGTDTPYFAGIRLGN